MKQKSINTVNILYRYSKNLYFRPERLEIDSNLQWNKTFGKTVAALTELTNIREYFHASCIENNCTIQTSYFKINFGGASGVRTPGRGERVGVGGCLVL